MRAIEHKGAAKYNAVDRALPDGLRGFFAEATKDGLTQEDMRDSIERRTGIAISRASVSNWLRDYGYKPYIVYRLEKRRRAA